MDERKNQTQLSWGLPRGPKRGQGPKGSGSHDPQGAAAGRALLAGPGHLVLLLGT